MFTKLTGVYYFKNKLSRISSSHKLDSSTTEKSNKKSTPTTISINDRNDDIVKSSTLRRKKKTKNVSSDSNKVVNRSQLTRSNSIPSHFALTSTNTSFNINHQKPNSLPNSPSVTNMEHEFIMEGSEEEESFGNSPTYSNDRNYGYFVAGNYNQQTSGTYYTNSNLLSPNEYLTIDLDMNSSFHNFKDDSTMNSIVSSTNKQHQTEFEESWSFAPNEIIRQQDKSKMVRFV